MKVAVLGDAHGNLHALEAVLRDIRKRRVDAIWNLGDAVGYGAFPEEVVEHIEKGACPRPRSLPFPKLVDLHDGQAAYDDTHWRKQPDWTYLPAERV